MLQFLETGQALYVLAGLCLLGIFTRVTTKNLYKRLIKESGNMATTKNKSLRDLKQKAESTYRMNQGMPDSSAWLDHQLCELRFRGMTLAGWGNVSMQLTWLCLLTGGTAAFFSYWYRLDSIYVVMYGGGSVLMAMLTMLFDNGIAGGKRELLAASLQDYLENVLCPRLARSIGEDSLWSDGAEPSRGKVRSITRLPERKGLGEGDLPSGVSGAGNQGARRAGEKAGQTERADRMGARGGKERSGTDRAGKERAGGAGTDLTGTDPADREHTTTERLGMERTGTETVGKEHTGSDRTGESIGVRKRGGKNARREAQIPGEESGGVRDVDYLKKSLEQIAASREKGKESDDSWLKELGPDEVQLIGDIIKEYLA